MIDKYEVTKDGELLAPESYFVVRGSDIFAPTALYNYASSIQTVLEVEQATGSQIFTEDVRERLSILADKLVMQAIEWSKSSSRVPD